MLYLVAANLVVMLHLAFIVFVVLGGLLTFRWPRLIYLHIPAAIWGVCIEIFAWTCPLTPLENHLRSLAGEAGYAGGFIQHLLGPVIYPPELSFGLQSLLAGAVILINLLIYAVWLRKRFG